MAGKTLMSAFERRIIEAEAAGEFSKEVNPQIAAQFLNATLVGLKIAARAGAPEETMRGIARMALRGLK
jgi:TetR/AcrR family transcriptional repressor of nem operon